MYHELVDAVLLYSVFLILYNLLNKIMNKYFVFSIGYMAERLTFWLKFGILFFQQAAWLTVSFMLLLVIYAHMHN